MRYHLSMKNLLIAAIAALVSVTASASTTSVYCTSLPNSTGQVAQIAYSGSLVRADNNLALNLSFATPHTFAQLTCGTVAMNVPFGNGVLCINPIPSFMRVGGPILTSELQPDGSFGFASRQADLTSLPQASTLYFQWWYRDTPQETITFNTSNAMSCVLN